MSYPTPGGHPEPSNEQLYPAYPPAPPQQPYQQQPYAQPYPQPYAQPYPQPFTPPNPYAPVDPRQQAYQNSLYAAQKSRVAAGLLGIFLGSLGIHNFYLGRTGIGILQLLLSVLTLGILAPGVAIWALIEGILILTRSPSFATDAKGVPLRD